MLFLILSFRKKKNHLQRRCWCFHSDGVSTLASCRESAQATNDIAGHLGVESTCCLSCAWQLFQQHIWTTEWEEGCWSPDHNSHLDVSFLISVQIPVSIPKDCRDIKGLRVKVWNTACQIPEEVIPNRGARMTISSHPRKEGSDSVGIQTGFSSTKSERSSWTHHAPYTLILLDLPVKL